MCAITALSNASDKFPARAILSSAEMKLHVYVCRLQEKKHVLYMPNFILIHIDKDYRDDDEDSIHPRQLSQ